MAKLEASRSHQRKPEVEIPQGQMNTRHASGDISSMNQTTSEGPIASSVAGALTVLILLKPVHIRFSTSFL